MICVQVKILLYVVIELSLQQTQDCKKGGGEIRTIRIRIEFVGFVFLNMQQSTFINLNRFARGNALYAENLITTYPVCFGRAL